MNKNIKEKIRRPEGFAQLGDCILRQQALRVSDVNTSHIKQIIKTMKTMLSTSKGVGVAAPQLFESLRIVIVASRPSERYPLAPKMDPVVMINPSFKVLSQSKKKDWEGCLSIPGIRALVPRYENIQIDYADEQGNIQELIAENFVARIFQHEYDHLNGLVYLDRVENNNDIIAESEFQKLMRNYNGLS
ncbi:MAG: peptide deformylase [Methylococcaceae bacterium]|nr:peptide deformylase [Methylococcaceae bacterium]